MSIFGKKHEQKQPPQSPANLFGQEPDLELDLEEGASPSDGPRPAYGITDAIRLMRSLPTDQNIDLIVKVVRVTLGSVNVRIEDIIEDATQRQKAIQDNIAALHEKVADLEEELEARRRDIAAEEADFKETTAVKERLVLAEKSAHLTGGQRSVTGANSLDQGQHQQPPPPPPPSRVLPKASPRE